MLIDCSIYMLGSQYRVFDCAMLTYIIDNIIKSCTLKDWPKPRFFYFYFFLQYNNFWIGGCKVWLGYEKTRHVLGNRDLLTRSRLTLAPEIHLDFVDTIFVDWNAGLYHSSILVFTFDLREPLRMSRQPGNISPFDNAINNCNCQENEPYIT